MFQQLARADAIFQPPGVHIILKWTKTLQTSTSHRVVPLASIPDSTLCPVRALGHMIKEYPLEKNDPMFAMRRNDQLCIVTQPPHLGRCFGKSFIRLVYSHIILLFITCVGRGQTWHIGSIFLFIIYKPKALGLLMPFGLICIPRSSLRSSPQPFPTISKILPRFGVWQQLLVA